MSSVVISGDSSGQVTLTVPAAAGTSVITLPASTGTTQLIGQGTVVNTTSGTTVSFTNIPSWAKRITLIFNGVSPSGTDNFLVQVGTSSGFVTTGYTSINANKSGATSTSTTGFLCTSGNAAGTTTYGNVVLLNVTGNTWVSTGVLMDVAAVNGNYSGGSLALAGTLDRVQLAMTGSNTFDAGSMNILYEG